VRIRSIKGQKISQNSTFGYSIYGFFVAHIALAQVVRKRNGGSTGTSSFLKA
jgi:hypothetical protein